MPVENVAAQFAQPVRSPAEYQNALTQGALAQGQLQQNQLAVMQARQQMSDQQGLRNYLSQPGTDLSTDEGKAGLLRAAPIAGQAILKNQADLEKSRAETSKFQGQGAQANVAALKGKVELFHQQLGGVNDYQSAVDWLNRGANDPVIGSQVGGPQGAQALIAQIPKPAQDPDGSKFAAWKANMDQAGMDAKDRVANLTTQRGQNMTQQTALTTTGMNNATSTANTATTASAHIKGAQIGAGATMGAAGIRANTELLINGFNKDGTPNTSSNAVSDAIAKGQLPPLEGSALVRPGGKALMGAALGANPTLDATTYAAKKATAVAFADGQQGNALRSVSTANTHLDQMLPLVDALKNGNINIINQAVNTFSKATGNPAVTNMEAVKNVVGQEVVKAIVANGGGQGEREEAGNAFANANSPEQLRGVIEHYRQIMGAQASNLIAQRKAAGVPDSTLPNYAPPASSNPGGFKYIGPAK